MLRLLLLLGITATGFIMGSKNNFIDSDEHEKLVLKGTMAYLEQVHFQPKDIDDEFSEMVYDLFIERLDYGKKIFTGEQIELLEPYKTTIDEQINATRFDFFNTAVEQWEQAIVNSKKVYEETIVADLDIHDAEEMELDPEKIDFPADDEELRDRWRQRIEYEIITRVERSKKADEKNMEDLQKSEEDYIEKAVKDTREMFDRYFDNMDDLRRSDHFEDFINCITFAVDPHSNYLSPKKKQDFDIGMSGKLEGIGASLTMDGDYTKVSSIVIGGPAWKDKRLEAKDLILKVAQGEDEWIDVVGWRLDDVVSKIRGKAGTIVRLFVKKVDGSTEEIVITRDEVEVGKQYAKSFIISPEKSNRTIGYIDLPKFYADFERGGRRCADDVAGEIEKLKADSVDGIILDLRGNPGGSLRDVVDMSGLFIEKGPIVQAVSKGNKNKVVFDDKDKNVQFSGPLIVMVDQFSASASEIMAAAIQDYERGLIVGVGGNTYGKGTVQRFYSLDRAFRGNTNENLGAVKMTIQKYYRINGSSVQNVGVEPDIILPGKFQFSEVGEKEYPTAMNWSEIEPTAFSQEVYHFDEKSLITRSNARVSNSLYFRQIQDQAKTFKKHQDMTLIPLSLEGYEGYQRQREEESKASNTLRFSDTTLVVSVPTVEWQEMASDTVELEKVEKQISGLKSDVYLSEAISIMGDMLTQGIIAANDQKKLDAIEVEE